MVDHLSFIGLLLFPLLWLAGYIFGKRKRLASNEEVLAHHYFQGVNFLLNEQPDQAIDTFIRSVDVTPYTLETHLALGNLMRQRGEVERAIRIHQNLLSRPNLNSCQSGQARLELGRDFLKAGLFDRAERLFLELVEDESGDFRQASLQHLIQIYRGEQEWEKAIRAAGMMAKKRFARATDELAIEQAQFCCELAEQSIKRKDGLQARRHLQSALKYNRNSARANMLWGRMEMYAGNNMEALKRFAMIPQQQPGYLPEILPLVRQCYEQLDDIPGLLVQLQFWLKAYPGASLLQMVVEVMVKQCGKQPAISFLMDYLREHLSIRGLQTLLGVSEDSGTEVAKEQLHLLQQLLNSLLARRLQYRCDMCGFSGAQLHWLCPQCLRWETVRPVRGIDGE
ncbi:lipopolysaccharide assembly protein LapB [Porticoccus sp.]|uniref:lipopolysaccharide assembly protein LapB n=1 Tax=Porticoccus sp. TaxID=2024853 RepID=UPI003F69BDFA